MTQDDHQLTHKARCHAEGIINLFLIWTTALRNNAND